MSLMLTIIMLLVLFSQHCYTQTTCTSSSCTPSNPGATTYTCTDTVDTCNINCLTNCNNLIIHSAATTTTITCGNDQACNNLQLICGYNNSKKSMTQCILNCEHTNTCNNVNVQCNGNIANCEINGQNSMAIDGDLTCNLSDQSNTCALNCGSTGSMCDTSAELSLTCAPDNIGTCLCNFPCPGHVIQTTLTHKPTTHSTTNPTINPTTNPTTNPTINPTYNPTLFPTVNPTFIPTYNPTFIPTYNPTFIPSTTPIVTSMNPTNFPTTGDPTLYPTYQPSVATDQPTYSLYDKTKYTISFEIDKDVSEEDMNDIIQQSLIAYTGVTIVATAINEGKVSVVVELNGDIDEEEIEKKIEQELEIKYQKQFDVDVKNNEYSNNPSTNNIFQQRSMIFTYLSIVIAVLFIILLISAYMHSKCIQINDFFKASALCTTLFHILDLLSDIFLSINIKARVKDGNYLFFILFISSLIFIIVPIVFSIGQLLHQIHKHWWRDDHIKLWLTQNNKILLFLSIFTGSSFTAVQLMHSHLFSKSTFSMGLNNAQYLRFEIKRIYSIILLENVPQLILQSIYLSETSEMDTIAISAMIFSLISIIVTIISMVTAKQILNSTGYAVVQFNITGKCVVSKANECKYKVIKIRNELSSVLGLKSEQLIEVIRPNNIPNGFEIMIQIHLNRIQIRDIDYQKLFQECQQSGNVAQIFQNAWDLNSAPIVSAINFKVQESKAWKKGVVSIKAHSENVEQMNNYLDNTVVPVKIQSTSDELLTNIELVEMPEVKETCGFSVDENEHSDSSVSNANGNTTKTAGTVDANTAQ